MTTKHVYIPFMLFNMRMVNMQHLWSPSTEYLGKKTDKPNYFITTVTQKTRASWWEEPLLAPAWAAYDQLLQKSGMTPQHVSEWPIKDGDMPPEPGKAPAEWAKGHWVLGGSSSNAIKVEMVQNGNVVPLPGKIGVKPGDFVALGCSAAIKQNNPRALKHFCNTVLFTGAGEEIAVGNSVSGAELMQHAIRQGLQPAGFSGSPGFSQPMQGVSPGAGGGFAPPMQHGHAQPNFGGNPGPAFGAPQPGFFPPNGAAPQPGFAPQTGPGGFAPTHGNPATAFPSNPGAPGPGFTPPANGFAPMTGNPAAPGFAAPGLGGPAFAGNATYPSNTTITYPGGFAAPQGPFPPR